MSKHLIICGMQRSGTTWLHRTLDLHPRICMAKPAAPEPKFFLDPQEVAGGYQAYRRMFETAEPGGYDWLGEKSVSYSEYGRLPRMISAVLQPADDVRCIFMLRHPIRRAVSNFRFSRSNGYEERGLCEALTDGLSGPARTLGAPGPATSVDPQAYLERGLYWRQIEPYLAEFGPRRVRLLVSEDTFGNAAAIGGLLRWLGLQAEGVPPMLAEQFNSSAGDPQDTAAALPDELYKALMDYYRQPNDDLAAHTGIDLSTWSRIDAAHLARAVVA